MTSRLPRCCRPRQASLWAVDDEHGGVARTKNRSALFAGARGVKWIGSAAHGSLSRSGCHSPGPCCCGFTRMSTETTSTPICATTWCVPGRPRRDAGLHRADRPAPLLAGARPAGQGRKDQPARDRSVQDAIQSLADNVIVGDPGVLASVGALAWVVAVLAAAVAYRRVGAPVVATVLLGLSLVIVSHPPPIGPIGLLCFAGAVALLARHEHVSWRLETAPPVPPPELGARA